MKNYSNSFLFRSLHTLNYLLFQKFRFYGSRKFGRTLAKIFLPQHQDTCIVPTVYNFDIVLPAKKNFEIEELYYLGFYEAGTLKIIQQILKKDDVFIDIGASVGLMSLYAAELVGNKGKIWSFEPMREMADMIRQSIHHNHLNNIEVFDFALGETECELPIFTNRACPSLIMKDNETSHQKVVVKVLDDIIKEKKLQSVKMMKIDVEGFELQVLRGCKNLLSSANAPILCIEYEGSYQNKEVFYFLTQINHYKFYQLEKGKALESKLVRIQSIDDLRINDNVICSINEM